MVFELSTSFLKRYNKCDRLLQNRVDRRLALFLENHTNPILNNHALKGKMDGYRSINITGDWRALYTTRGDGRGVEIAVFQTLGTHSQLY